MGSIAILSGRYVLCHPGHIKTIRREARRFDTLYVYIVDDPKGMVPSYWAKETIGFATKDLGNVIPILDPCHFGYATQDDIDRLPKYDVFLVAGNQQVYDQLQGLGVPVEMIPATEGYSSTDVKEGLLRDAVASWREREGK